MVVSFSCRVTVWLALNPLPDTAMMLLSSGVTAMAAAPEMVYSVYALTFEVCEVMLYVP